MAKNIQELRRKAGYRSAKDFSAAMGIPESTYNRYESQPSAIPLKQAWAIADFLGCSIDAVVGREPVSEEESRGEMQVLYDSLLPEQRYLMSEFAAFVRAKDEAVRGQRKVAEQERYERMARRYESSFWRDLEEEAEFGDEVSFASPEDERQAFESYLRGVAAGKRASAVATHCRGLEEELREGYLDADGNARDLTEDEIGSVLDGERESMESEQERRDEEVIARVMEAYDRLHATAFPGAFAQTAIEYLGR